MRASTAVGHVECLARPGSLNVTSTLVTALQRNVRRDHRHSRHTGLPPEQIDDDPTDAVLFETIRRFTGMEASVIVLVELPDEEHARGRFDALLYVALTRATSSLTVIATPELAARLCPCRQVTNDCCCLQGCGACQSETGTDTVAASVLVRQTPRGLARSTARV